MKKSLYLLLLSLLLVAFCFTMTACDSDDEDDSSDTGNQDSGDNSTGDKPSSDSCDHIFESTYKTDDEAHWFDCANGCGAKYKVGAHVLGDPVVVTEASCTAPGKSERTCIVCEYKKVSVIKQKNHVPNGVYEADEANHTQGCKTCTDYKFEEAHTFTSLGYNGDEHWKYCKCGKKVDVAAHTWTAVNPDDNSVNRQEKCTFDGCNATRTAPNEGHQHEFDTDVALGTVTTPATCTSQGVVTFTCKTPGCNGTTTASINELPHSYDGDWDYDALSHWHKCSSCGTKPPAGQNYIEEHVLGKPTTDGYSQVYKCECGYSESVESGGYIDPDGWT